MKSQKHYSKRQHSRGSRRSSNGGGGGGGGGGNPLSRVYESNGPDVKVRGTAQTVAEKYLQLGRDAHVSGDNVMAESYYQHAEHYLRIVAAAQAYTQQTQQQYRRPSDDELLDGEETDETEEATGDEPAQADRPSYPRNEQPDMQQDQAAGAADGERPPPYSRRDRSDQGQERGDRDRYGKSRWDRGRDRSRSDQPPREQREFADPARQPQPRIEDVPPARQPRIEDAPRGRAVEANDAGAWEAPSFLRRPSLPEANGERRPRYERKPKRDSAESESTAEAPRATEDAPPAE